MRVFLTSIFAQLLLTGFISWSGRRLLPNTAHRRLLYLLLGMELSLYFIGYFFYSSLPDTWLVLTLAVCNTWFIASIYLSLLLFMVEIVRFIHKRMPCIPRKFLLKSTIVKPAVFMGIIFLVATLLTYGYYQVAHPVVRHVSVDLNKGQTATDSVRLVVMTDLHIGELIGEKTLNRYVDLANQQQGDLILLGGDIVDYELRFADQANASQLLSQLKAPLGVYAVLGNHEYRASIHAKKKWLREIEGLTLLVDSVVSPKGAFYLIGRDDYINKQRKKLSYLLLGKDKRKPVIVLDHQPAAISEMVMNKIDLGIHGHTHGGQIWPNNHRLKFVYEFVSGLHRKGASQFFVSNGVGSAYPLVRIGTRSEVVVMVVRW